MGFACYLAPSTNVCVCMLLQTYTNGLFTINCVVLVEGEVVDDVLHVHVRRRTWTPMQAGRHSSAHHRHVVAALFLSIVAVHGVSATRTESAIVEYSERH